MSIKSLISKWREPQYGSEIKTICANDLESALPVWTEIADNEDTWPELDPEYGIDEVEVIARFPDALGKLGTVEGFMWDAEVCVSIMNGDRIGYIGGIYRLTCDLDTP